MLLTLAAVLVASAGWYVLRPHLIRLSAQSSLGCEARRELILAALQAAYPEPGIERPPDGAWLMSFSRPAPGSVVWGLRGRDGLCTHYRLVDARLHHAGAVVVMRGDTLIHPAPADHDHDGSLEVTYVCSTGTLDGTRIYWTTEIAVLRVRPDRNEVAGLVRLRQPGSTWGDFTYGVWQDEDGDGVEELLIRLRLVSVTRPPKSKLVYSEPETLAVLEWTEPGGVLRPRSLSADGSLEYWAPPLGHPLAFPCNGRVDKYCRRLWPLRRAAP